MTGAEQHTGRSGRRGPSVHRRLTGTPLTREELARERAAAAKRRQPAIDAALARSTARKEAELANPTHPVPRSHPLGFRELICAGCRKDFSARRGHGRPPKYCARCRK